MNNADYRNVQEMMVQAQVLQDRVRNILHRNFPDGAPVEFQARQHQRTWAAGHVITARWSQDGRIRVRYDKPRSYGRAGHVCDVPFERVRLIKGDAAQGGANG